MLMDVEAFVLFAAFFAARVMLRRDE